MIKNILLITSNPGKKDEFNNTLGKSICLSTLDLPIAEIQSLHPQEVGRNKTESALKFKDEIQQFDAILTDDTSLSCSGLNGLPGALIKWFLSTLGPIGIVNLIQQNENQATATCVLSLGIVKSNKIIQFEGSVNGKLVMPRGGQGFGWDGIFQLDKINKTYSELGQTQKNKISHRALAMKRLLDWLKLHS